MQARRSPGGSPEVLRRRPGLSQSSDAAWPAHVQPAGAERAAPDPEFDALDIRGLPCDCAPGPAEEAATPGDRARVPVDRGVAPRGPEDQAGAEQVEVGQHVIVLRRQGSEPVHIQQEEAHPRRAQAARRDGDRGAEPSQGSR